MKRYSAVLALVAIAAIFGLSRLGRAQCGGMHSGGHEAHAEQASSPGKVIIYPIDFCVVSGEKLGEMGEPVKYDYKGRTVMFCCKGCVKKFEAEPAKYITALDAAIAAASSGDAKTTAAGATDTTATPVVASDTTPAQETAKPVTLDWCVVSGEKLGEMGDPVPYKYKDREFTFCCKGCIKQFDKNPTAYMARLDSALAGQVKQPAPVQDEHGSGHSH